MKNSYNDELKETAQGYKCGECDFMSLHKHTNTHHEGYNEKTENQETKLISDAIGDQFQKEIFACTVYDEEFDKKDAMKKTH